MNPSATLADLGSGFTPKERQLLSSAVLEQCDALDGARDGMVQATQACQARFNLQKDVPTCQGERNGQCLTVAQKQVVAAVFSGAKTATGQPIYASFPYDTGVSGANWATWKFVNALALDPLAVGAMFSVPPGRVDPLKEDVSTRWPLFSATDDSFRESGLSLMTPPGQDNPVNLGALRARGAKMVLFHGVSDAVFSAEDTRRWIERLDQAQDGKAADFARYFPVPGMNHCSGGPAADQFDLLTPLVQWVEQGVAPQAVPASVRAAPATPAVRTPNCRKTGRPAAPAPCAPTRPWRATRAVARSKMPPASPAVEVFPGMAPGATFAKLPRPCHRAASNDITEK
jgi:hypothetical protein